MRLCNLCAFDSLWWNRVGHATSLHATIFHFILLFLSSYEIHFVQTFCNVFLPISHSTEEPKPTLNCPRLNGYFGHKGTCDKFYYCVDGMFNMIVCPSGLVFNPKTGMAKRYFYMLITKLQTHIIFNFVILWKYRLGICTWPDEAQKRGCSSEGKLNFIHLRFNCRIWWIFMGFLGGRLLRKLSIWKGRKIENSVEIQSFVVYFHLIFPLMQS